MQLIDLELDAKCIESNLFDRIKKVISLVLVFVLCIFLNLILVANSFALHAKISSKYNLLYNYFDCTQGARSTTPNNLGNLKKHDMSAAITAIAMLIHDKNSSCAKTNLEYLLNKAMNATGFGWGLGISWEAFANGVIKDANVIYGIQTAWAIKALLDMYEMDGNIKYLIGAISAANYYKQFFTHESRLSGYFWYDNQNSDAISVTNVNAMLMSQYARIYNLFPYFFEKYKSIAIKAYNHLHDSRKINSNTFYWTYSSLNSNPNDLVHAVLTVEGILETEKYLNLPSQRDKLLPYLSKFFGTSNIYEDISHTKTARLWGVGMLMYIFCNYESQKKIKDIENLLKYTEYYKASEEPSYHMYQHNKGFNIDASAHLLLGLSRCSLV